MTAITFFPFTHVTQEDIRSMGAFFQKVTGLSLAGKTEATEDSQAVLQMAHLPDDQLADLDARVGSYQSWAQLHKGNEKNLKNLIRKTPYLKTETDLTSIQSQIRKGFSGGELGGESGEATFLDPLLFLKFAQILDQENQTIDESLSALDKGNTALFAELKGEAESSGSEAQDLADISRVDPGQTMPGERIAAWAETASRAGLLTNDPKVLVTTSPGIMDYLTANAHEVINGLDIPAVKVHENDCTNQAGWFRDFETILDQIITGKTPPQMEALKQPSGCCKLSGQIKLCLFPRGQLQERFKIPGQHTAVCLVQLNS